MLCVCAIRIRWGLDSGASGAASGFSGQFPIRACTSEVQEGFILPRSVLKGGGAVMVSAYLKRIPHRGSWPPRSRLYSLGLRKITAGAYFCVSGARF
jgi:hypothetical protein